MAQEGDNILQLAFVMVKLTLSLIGLDLLSLLDVRIYLELLAPISIEYFMVTCSMDS